MKKPCPGCGQSDLSKFRLMKGKYYPPKCIECERKDARENRKRQYHDLSTQAVIKAQNKAYSSKPDRKVLVKQRSREKYLANSVQIIAKSIAYKKRPENKARRNKLWRDRYVIERDSKRAEFKRKYYADPSFRLRGNIRSRVWEALKLNGGSKNSSILKALDYSLEELKFHLESQFTPGMSWEISKSFSVDHIIPQSMFQFTSIQDEEFRLCWALDNLRPLSLSQNFGDGDRHHLFDGCSTWTELTTKIRSWPLGSEPEQLDSVLRELGMCIPSNNSLPQLPIGLGLLDNIFTNRFSSNASGKRSLSDAYSDDKFLLKIAAYIISSGRLISKSLFYRNAAFLNKAPSHFFPSAATALVKKYASGGDVIDPFLGWGGRTLGALCGGAMSICGTDLQPDSIDGCRRLVDDYAKIRMVDSEFLNQDFATYLQNTERRFDLLMTSPPFMATEDYGVKGHPDVRSWSEQIVQPLVRGALRVVKSGGHVALHGQDRRNMPVLTTIMTAFMTAGFEKVAEYRYGKTSGQSVVVFQH